MKAAVYLALISSVQGVRKTKAEIGTYITGLQTGKTKCSTATTIVPCVIGGTVAAPVQMCCLQATSLTGSDGANTASATGWCGDVSWAGAGAAGKTWYDAGGALELVTGTLACKASSSTKLTTDAELKKEMAKKTACPASNGECPFATGTFTPQCCLTGKGTPLNGTENKNTAGFCDLKTVTTYVEAFPTLVGVKGDLANETKKKASCTTLNATKTELDTAIKALACPKTGCWTEKTKYDNCCMTATVSPNGTKVAKDQLTGKKYCAPKTATAGPPTSGAWKGATVTATCHAAILTVSAAAALAVASTI